MASESNTPSSAIRPGGPSSGPTVWPDRRQHSPEWWGKLHFVPQPGDPSRMHMFAKPAVMSADEEDRIIANWRRMTDGHGPAMAMAHDIRPSTPRAARAEKRIEKLRDEGVDVVPLMEMRIRDVIENNSGFHEALRHYTQGESNVLIPYLNELAHREDKMLLEWARQRRHDYELWQQSSSQRSFSQPGAFENISWWNTSPEQPEDPKDPSTLDSDQTHESDNNKSTVVENETDAPLAEDKPSSTTTGNKDKTPSQGESSKGSKASKGLIYAQNEAAAKKRFQEEQRMEIIRNLEAQITALDRNIGKFDDNVSTAVSSPNAASPTGDDPFGRVVELLRGVLEEKQRKLCTLNKARSRAIRSQKNNDAPASPPDGKPSTKLGQQERSGGGFVGALRWAWNRCTESSESAQSSRAGSRAGSREDLAQPTIQDRQPRTPTMGAHRRAHELSRVDQANIVW